MKTKFLRVTGGSAESSSFTAESVSAEPTPVADVSGQKDEIPWDTNHPDTAESTEDDTMSYFAKLADG